LQARRNKKLIFVCRDFSRHDKKNVIRKKLEQNLENIWEKTKISRDLYNWFDVHYSFLPNALDFEVDFKQKVKSLRRMFLDGDDCIFESFDNMLSSEFLQEYSSSFIQKINSDENLNADNELEIAARLQVDRTKQKALDLVKQNFHELLGLEAEQLIDQFLTRAEEIKQTAQDHFIKNAKKKFIGIYKEEKRSLLAAIDEQLLAVSRFGLEQVCNRHLQKFRADLDEHSESFKDADEFREYQSSRLDEEIKAFREDAKKLILEQPHWKELVEFYNNALKCELEGISLAYETNFDKNLNETLRQNASRILFVSQRIEEELKELIVLTFDSCQESLFYDIFNNYKEVLKKEVTSVLRI